MITSVLDCKGRMIEEEKIEISEWVYNPRIIGKNKRFS